MNMHLCQKAYVQMLIEEDPLICACHHRSFQAVLASLPHHTDNRFTLAQAKNVESAVSVDSSNRLAKSLIGVADVSKRDECDAAALVAIVQDLTGASTGCGSCLAKVQGIVQCYCAKPEIFQQPLPKGSIKSADRG